MTFTFVEVAAQKICEAAAKAVHRYVEVSGDPPSTMPEYFMNSYVFDKLGSKMTMTLETGIGTLISADNEVGATVEVSPRAGASEDKPHRDKIDLVLYDDRKGTHKHHLPALALIEFKLWNTNGRRDIDKLLRCLGRLEKCQSGIVCGIIDDNRDFNDFRELYGQKLSDQAKGRWSCVKVPSLDYDHGNHYSVHALAFTKLKPMVPAPAV